ncbi:MAG: GGDEF domain-containing protein [Gammaproteobacteria bacterium]|nr:GGDEF domain-containing protein [Gammaproteobacteria bacterium]MDH3413080.1 GGDEF domain-containing protein [Gammaproteobacteria bacterium]
MGIGVAVALPAEKLSPQDLMPAADLALYAAKDAGRNGVESTALGPDLKHAGGRG